MAYWCSIAAALPAEVEVVAAVYCTDVVDDPRYVGKCRCGLVTFLRCSRKLNSVGIASEIVQETNHKCTCSGTQNKGY